MDGVLTRPHRLFALFLAWWCGELAALVPRRARRLFHRGARILVLEPSREEVVLWLLRGERCREIGRVDLEGEDGAAQAAAIRALTRRVNLNKTEIALRLPAAQALRRTLDLPRSAEPDLRQALFFQIDQQTPFTPQEVYFDYRVTGRQPEAKRLTVEMTVVPRTVVGDALAMAARWGLSPAIVDVAGDDADAPPLLNLLSEEEDATEARGLSPLNAALAVVAAVLAVAAVSIPLDQRRTTAETLLARVAEVKSDASQAIRLRQEVDRLRKESRYLAEEKRKTLSVIKILDELTRIMPDSTWIFDLKISGREIRIGGYSSAASQLVGLIDDSPLFRTPRFRASVTQDPRSGLERFNLSFEVEEKGVDR